MSHPCPVPVPSLCRDLFFLPSFPADKQGCYCFPTHWTMSDAGGWCVAENFFSEHKSKSEYSPIWHNPFFFLEISLLIIGISVIQNLWILTIFSNRKILEITLQWVIVYINYHGTLITIQLWLWQPHQSRWSGS